MKRRSSIAGPLVLVALLSGGAGWLAGRASLPAPEPAAPVITVVACDEPKIPAQQGISAIPPPVAHRTPQPPKAVSPGTPLPPLATEDEQREKLLAYVRDRAGTLRDCAGAARERLRLTLRIEVGGDGAVRKVEVLEDDPARRVAGACVSQRMAKWVLPQEWVRADRALLVAVVL